MVTFIQHNNDAVENAIRHIQSQLEDRNKTTFEVDETIATLARNVFLRNYRINQCISGIGKIFGAVGVIALGSAFMYVSLKAVTISIICLAIFINLRNREGYCLQKIYRQKLSPEATIRQLSLGANIYQPIWAIGGVAPGLFSHVMGRPGTIYQSLARSGECEALAYTLMLEKNRTKRADLATEALPDSENVEVAQLLLKFGARLDNPNLFFLCGLMRKLELANFFVKNGAKLDKGISDYVRWNDQDPYENDTILEELIYPEATGPYLPVEPKKALEALEVDPSIYEGKKTAKELYHALNQNGVRIRYRWAEYVFQELNKNPS
ncbi:MAG: hypothetical protein Tsb0021_11610 [Chlamydiales bacterium]